ncbi:MAG: MerC domain-containing protein [Candidatus Eremiobacteraeota bacterium]|nr:MerC domain-containing protein [Candidatus Eremiobacteraeota bacterium]
MSRAVRWADSAGVIGAVFAALCCAGAPVILSVLAAVGLSALRRDAILLPLMVVSLGIALWGFWTERRRGGAGPLALAAVGATALIAAVVFVHGPPARLLIDGGALALVAATVWNIWTWTGRRPSLAATAAEP